MLGGILRRLADRSDALVVRPRASVWLLVLAAFAGVHGVALLLPEERLIAAFHDDAFYYFGVARNLVAGNGFTFDGIHATNGFHPLWLAAILPVFAVAKADAAALRVILAVQIALTTIAALAVYRELLPRLGPGAVTAALALVGLPGAAYILTGGLESSLVLIILVMTWIRFERVAGSEEASPVEWLVVGLLCATAFLARFEALVLTPTCCLLGLRRLREDPRRAALLLGPPAVAALGYAVWNRAAFDTWLSVSGLVKSEWASWATPWQRIANLLSLPWFGSDLLNVALVRAGVEPGKAIDRVAQAALLFALLAAAWKFRRVLSAAVQSSRAGFLVVATTAWLAMDKVAILYIETWNRVPLHLCTAIILGGLVFPRRRLAAAMNVILFAFAISRMAWTAGAWGGHDTAYPAYRHRAAQWLREEAPADARIGSWNAGLLGYFSHRAVVSLDGLVNDRRYFEEVVVGGDLDGYLRREGIAWIADQACGREPSLRPYLSRTASERLEPEFVIEAVFAAETPDRCPGYVIWRREASDSIGTASD